MCKVQINKKLKAYPKQAVPDKLPNETELFGVVFWKCRYVLVIMTGRHSTAMNTS